MVATQTKDQIDTDQSVYVADKEIVKTYPIEMSNDEIDFDLHTTVRGQTPEDYYVNFLPLRELQQGWKFIRASDLLDDAVDALPAKQAVEGVGKALKYESDVIQPALKFAVADPAAALGFSEETSPKALEDTYKPWLDLWRESEFGKVATDISDEALTNLPLPVAAVPWFFTEFVPDQLLEFGTKASNWVGLYGVEKFGPPLINAALSKLPPNVRSVLLKDIFSGEKALAKDFETLGLKMNTKTSEVKSAYRKAAQVTHPDIGGNPNEFNAVNKAYQRIMKSRAGWMDKLFDVFRDSMQKKTLRLATFPTPPEIRPGDMVKIGSETGKFIKAVGEMAFVNVAGKTLEVELSKLKPFKVKKEEAKVKEVKKEASKELAKPEKPPKLPLKQQAPAKTPEPEGESAVNLERIQASEEAKTKLREATNIIQDEIENQTGKPITHEEVLEKSKEAELLTKGVSREATLQFEASLLKTRQHMAALAEQNELTPEFLDSLRVTANIGTDIARSLESMKIGAVPEYAATKIKLIKNLIKLGKSSQEILDASKGVDFTQEQAVAKFYRQFVKPTLPEMLDEFVYINILSSPITHIVNTFSNLIQLAGLNPLTKLASGAVDAFMSNLTGSERTHYVSEVPAFFKGVINAVPEAFKGVLNALKGKKTIERPDVQHLPTLSKLVDWGTLKIGKYVPRALEASDIFFRTLVEAGEIEVLSKKLGHTPSPKELLDIKKQAREKGEYYVFRKKTDATNETGQGDLLSAIDQMTNAIYKLRSVPGMKWFIRFVQTPMNIVKQGIEYSPAGAATLKGAKDKTEQAGKTLIGSLVFAGGSWLAANNLLTWAAPTSERERNEFYAAGLQPYSVRIGDFWVSFSKIGPLAYPLAMAAALHYYTKDSPKALSDSNMDKIVDAMMGIMRFFSDQSYMQGLGDLVKFAHGEKSKFFASVPTQLIPLSSLQGWVNNIMDEIKRKPEKGLSIKSVVENIKMKIVGMSKSVPAQIDQDEIPVKKEMRVVNAVSPMRVSKVNKGKLSEYKENVKDKQEENKIKKELSQ